MANSAEQTVLIVGASRGLGFALAEEWLARGWKVIATERGTGNTELQQAAYRSKGMLQVEQLDMTDSDELQALNDRLAGYVLDMLFINAGVALGARDRVDQVTTEEFTRIMVTNTLGPMRVIEALSHLVRKDGTIAAMSSSLGSVALNESGGWEVYRASKAALNTLMRSYAVREQASGRTLALVDPGWVRTDMGGANATLTIEESIPRVVDALAAHAGQPGLRYFNYLDKDLPW